MVGVEGGPGYKRVLMGVVVFLCDTGGERVDLGVVVGVVVGVWGPGYRRVLTGVDKARLFLGVVVGVVVRVVVGVDLGVVGPGYKRELTGVVAEYLGVISLCLGVVLAGEREDEERLFLVMGVVVGPGYRRELTGVVVMCFGGEHALGGEEVLELGPG